MGIINKSYAAYSGYCIKVLGIIITFLRGKNHSDILASSSLTYNSFTHFASKHKG